MLVKTYCAAVNGLEVTTVTVEVSLNTGVMYHLTGLGDEAVKESRNRIAAAMQYSGYKFPIADITINLAPANLRKEGSSFDLPLAIGILGANGNIPEDHLKEYMMVGELSLDGTLQPIKGALPIAIRARSEHYKGLIVPEQNAREAAVVNNLEVYGMKNLFDVIQFLGDKSSPQPTIVDTRKEFYENQVHCDYDYADVKGQENVKRALEVAAAGGHNLIMVGPPGSGKSMMAKRLPSILPPLTLSESLETTQIHSIAGKLGKNVSLIAQRPFRAPHHTISQVALVGGGTSPQPGEISLAHNGVLFCDELPEFNKTTLEVLRQPLEDRHQHQQSQIHHRLPLLIHVCSKHEPMSLRLLWRSYASLCLHPGTDTTLYEQDFRSIARPHRHPVRNQSCTFQGHLQGSPRRTKCQNQGKSNQSPRDSGRKIQKLQGNTL